MSVARMNVGGLCTALRAGGSGRALLLIHGLGCSGVYFQPLQRRLAANFTVYTPDLPGHGQSAKPETTMWRLCELTDWIAGLIRELRLERPIIVGHSLGGGIAVDLAARYPQHVRGAVLVAPTGVPEMPPLLCQLPLLLADGLLEPWCLFPLVLPAYVQAGPRRITRLAVDQTRYGHRQRLHQITAPLLVMRGRHDPIVAPAVIDDLRNECTGVQAREIGGAAHASHVSHPQRVAELIAEFAATIL